MQDFLFFTYFKFLELLLYVPLNSFGVGRLPGIYANYTMAQLFYKTMMYPLNNAELIKGYRISAATLEWFSKMNILEAINKNQTKSIIVGSDAEDAASKFLYFNWHTLLQYYNGDTSQAVVSSNYDMSQYFYTKIPVASVAYLYGIDNIESSPMKFGNFVLKYLARENNITDSEFRLSDIPLVSGDAFILHTSAASVIMHKIKEKEWDQNLFKVTEKVITDKKAPLFNAYHQLDNKLVRGQSLIALQKMIGEMTGSLEMPSLDVLFRVSLNDLMSGKGFPMRKYGSMRLIDLMVHLSKGTVVYIKNRSI